MSVRRTERLSSIAEINPPLSSEVRPDSKVSFVTMSAVSEAAAAVASEEIRDAKDCLRGFTPFQRGDVLVAKITPCFENGKIVIANIERKFGFGSTEFHVVRPDARHLDVRYLLHCLRQPHVRLQGQRRMTGSAGQRRVPAHFLSTFEIPLCTLHEQQRIAAILDAADALRATRREALAQLDTLLQSTFLDMFGDPVTNPMGWEVVPLQSLIDEDRPITYGILKPGPDIDNGIPYVRVVDIRNEQVLTDQLRRTTKEIADQYRRSQLKPGDLLMSIRGHVGRMAITPGNADGANITQDTARLALADADATYVMQCISTQGMQHYMARRTKGVAVRGINLGDVKKLPIPTPPLSLQRRFAAIVESVEQQKTRMRAHLAELDALFACLQSRAFTGQL